MKICPSYGETKGVIMAYCSENCPHYEERKDLPGEKMMTCKLLPAFMHRSNSHARICEPWVMEMVDPRNVVDFLTEKHTTERLVLLCGDVIRENEILRERRKEAVESSLKHKTRCEELLFKEKQGLKS